MNTHHTRIWWQRITGIQADIILQPRWKNLPEMWRDSTVKWRHVQAEQRRRRTSPLQNPACFDPTVFFFRNVWRLTQKQREEYRRHRGWESRTCNGAGNNALRLPSRSFGRPVSEGATGRHHQRTHEQNGPETDLHRTHASKSNLCCRRPTHLSPQSGRRRRRWRSRERRASDATPLHRHAELGRQIKVPPVLLRDVLSDWVPLGLHLSSLSSLTPLPHKMLERRREEAGEQGA